jgi:hypothetical protein
MFLTLRFLFEGIPRREVSFFFFFPFPAQKIVFFHGRESCLPALGSESTHAMSHFHGRESCLPALGSESTHAISHFHGRESCLPALGSESTHAIFDYERGVIDYKYALSLCLYQGRYDCLA